MNNTNKFGRALFSSILAASLFACQSSDDKAEPVKEDVTAVTSTVLKTASDLPHYLERSVQDDVFYFVLPDRFYNAETSNDNGSKTILLSQGGFDPTHKGMYHGGDVPGLEAKLPYLKEMGVSAIWLTPIMRNQALQDDPGKVSGQSSGYHGYWILDFTEIDPHLGTNDDLKSFIDAAHKENIKVFFDIIVNHTADVIKYEECHTPEGKKINDCEYKTLAQTASGDAYTPFLPKGTENIKVPAWLNDPKYYHNQGETTFEGENSIYGDFAGLDDLNTDDPEVVQGFIDIFKDTINEFKPDGFRVDTVRHVNMEFWSTFAPALVEHAKSVGLPQFFIFGEVYDANPDVLSSFTTIGKMQSVLDFGFQDAIKKSLIEKSGTDVFAKLFAQDVKYNDEDSYADHLLNFVGNHDMGRMAYMLNDSKEQYSEDEKNKRILLGHALMYFARGIPVVYYGDEQGFVGDGNDQDSRQNMMPSQVATYNDDDLLATDKTTADDNFDSGHPYYQAFAKYADVYFSHAALRYGKQDVIYSQATPGALAFTRKTSTDNLLVVANTASESITQVLEVSDKFELIYAENEQGTNIVQTEGNTAITLPALSFAIYQAK